MKVTEGSIQKGDSVGTNGNVFSLLKTTWKLILSLTLPVLYLIPFISVDAANACLGSWELPRQCERSKSKHFQCSVIQWKQCYTPEDTVISLGVEGINSRNFIYHTPIYTKFFSEMKSSLKLSR